MNKDVRQAVVSIAVIGMVLLGVGAGYFLWQSDMSFLSGAAPALSYRVHCDKALLESHGLGPGKFSAVERALRANAKHVRKSDMFVDVSRQRKNGVIKTDEDKAQFFVGLSLNSGLLLQSRLTVTPWDKLDMAMADAIERSMKTYFHLLRVHGGSLSGTALMNL